MNRYGRGPAATGGSSKATATTLCQKCLKRDMHVLPKLPLHANFWESHYSYECKTGAQERPYVSRPSRTAQLMNPKLVPKLTSDVPQDLLRKKGIADEQLAKAERERGLKRERHAEDEEVGGNAKRMRSASVSSVSTISTRMSRTPSPQQTTRESDQATKRASLARSPLRRRSSSYESDSRSRSRSPVQRALTDSEKKRRRHSTSSVDSYSTGDGAEPRDRVDNRNTRRRYRQDSPHDRGRRSESRNELRGRRRSSNDRPVGRNGFTNGGPALRNDQKENRLPPRERSLSPFSKRLALTQAMNMGR